VCSLTPSERAISPFAFRSRRCASSSRRRRLRPGAGESSGRGPLDDERHRAGAPRDTDAPITARLRTHASRRNVCAVSYAKELLDSAPERPRLDSEALAAAIDACSNAGQASVACANACLGEDHLDELRTAIALDESCADVCAATASVLSRPVRADWLLVQRLLQACVRACASSGEECGRHADHHRHCAICAEASRACVDACNDLLEAEAFEEVQKLAGG
jgi:hypothetical protein